MPSGSCATARSPNPVIWPSCSACCRSCTTQDTDGDTTSSSEAIRLTRQLTLATPEPEARGLLALMLLQHARLPARTDAAGRFVTLDEQDRSLWDTAEIAEAVAILQGALAEQRPGRYQILAAIAALHADASTSAETDWTQILDWYDDLVALSDGSRS